MFLTLKVFSATGGIEKVCRVAGKAFFEKNLSGNVKPAIFCMYDRQEDAYQNRYFPSDMFRGFGGSRLKFIFSALRKGRKCNTVILSHVNLLLVAWLIKKISPSTKIVLFAHGIEVWELLNNRQKLMLRSCDEIICVSNYTSRKMKDMHQIPDEKCVVLNNCLDPFLPRVLTAGNKVDLRKRYKFDENNIVLYTLSRLSSGERYKGYDKVLEAMGGLMKKYPGIRYVLGGSYDEKEKTYLDKLIFENGLMDYVSIPGFIKDEELVDHFLMADIYVMPSTKEGFGIVFIEAMYYGLPVIAGNLDGSTDALGNGKFGILVDPLEVKAIENAIESVIRNRSNWIPDRQQLTDTFGFETYKRNLDKTLSWV